MRSQLFGKLVFTALTATLAATAARAQVKPAPQAPVLGPVAPLGAQRGTALDLELTGSNLAGPTGLLASFPAKVTIPAENNNGKDNAKLRVRLEVPADAPLGLHTLHLATTRGVSNLRAFCVDELPQVAETGANKERAAAQPLPVPCVVAGKVEGATGDWYKIQARAGQRLSFDVLARRLGSPLDPQVSVYSATGRLLAYSNDAPGLQADARLTWAFPEAGEYVIEVKDVLYRGGADYWYRLRVGDFPCATASVPLAAKRGAKVTVRFDGPAVEDAAPVEVAVPADPAADVVWVTPRGKNGLPGWPVALKVSDLDEKAAAEPNDQINQANKVSVPGGITSQLERYGDTDLFAFAGRKGQPLLIEGHTLELYSPAMLYLVVKDAKGAELAKSNAQADPPADQRVEFTPPADGDYFVAAQHINYDGGPGQVYRLTVAPKEPTFDVALELDRWDVTAGGGVALPLKVTRAGYAGPIAVALTSADPRVSGAGTVEAGQAAGYVLVEAKADAPVGPFLTGLIASADVNGRQVTRPVSVRAAVSSALLDLPYPPLDLNTRVALAVTPKPPFTLAAKLAHGEAVPGINTEVMLTVERPDGFTEAVTPLAPTGLPGKAAAPKLDPIAKDKNEVKVALTIPADTPLGKYAVTFTAKAGAKEKEVVARANPLILEVTRPFALMVEPVKLTLKPGDKAKVTVGAERKGGYQGPVAVELRNLPAGVSAAKATVAQGQSAVEIELTAAAGAAPATAANVEALGTAPAAGNQQQASPPFTVAVEKK